MPDTPLPSFELTREAILDGAIRRRVAAADPSLRLVSDEENRASIAAMLAARPDGGGDLWLFAYGSLIWNPTIHFVERRVATVRGWHRRFCLWTRLGRGTEACPGLTLALERGGLCRGVAFRIAADAAETELEVVWRREMLTGAYRARWVRMTTAEGPGWAIAFVINRGHEHYAGLLPESRVVETIAAARGPLGACATYLFNTVAHLEALGVHDHRLVRLRRDVLRLQQLAGGTAP
jgi:cation transport protein ChaC